MAAPVAFLNGVYLPADRAGLPLHDAGFVQGATVTDLVRTFRHQPFRWEQHLTRFRESCRQCRVPMPHSDREITGWMRELVARNAELLPPGADLGIVLFATPGPIGHYAGLPGGPGDGPPTFGMHSFPLPFARYRRMFAEGGRLVVPTVRQVPQNCVSLRAKQRSRMHWWLAQCEAHDVDPMADALLLDEMGCVTETASANLLVVLNGDVLTPRGESVLGGVTLRVVREICAGLGIGFYEESLTPADCHAAEEIMLTCTSWCVAGVSRFDGRPVPWPGPIYEKIARAFDAVVGLDYRGQIAGGA